MECLKKDALRRFTKPSAWSSRGRRPEVSGVRVDADKRIKVNKEKSLFDDRPRSLIQMATGSTGKAPLTAAAFYQLIQVPRRPGSST